MTKIGFIGLGIMGEPMATSVLKAGHQLTVFDVRREVANPLLEKGATWADSPQAVAQASEVVMTSLPGPTEIEAVALGEGGIIHGIASGSLYIDQSTGSPAMLRRTHGLFKEKGVDLIDAPVLGGRPGIWERRAMILSSGDEAAFQRGKPILDSIAETVKYCGSIGSATVCKLMYNCIGYSLAASIFECFTTAVKAGVDPRFLWEAISEGKLGEGFIGGLRSTLFTRDFDKPRFLLKNAHKDVALATDVGREVGVPMVTNNMTRQLLLEAINRGLGEKDSRSILLVQEERAGVKVHVKE